MKTKIYALVVTVLLFAVLASNAFAKTAPPREPRADYDIVLQEYEFLRFQCHDGRPLDVREDSRDPSVWFAECMYYGIDH